MSTGFVLRDEGRDGAPVALVLPGRGYDVDQPLLARARAVLLARGWRVRSLAWEGPPPTSTREVRDVGERLCESAPRLLVAKSLTSRLLPLAVERGLPGCWLTPLLHEEEVRAAVSAVAGRAAGAPALLVGGAADESWDSSVARASGHRVVEVPGADHSLEVPGRPEATAAALALVGQELAAFSDRVVAGSGSPP
ncbi:alpha/beta hydrolase [Kineococcus sp. R8]|uniref:alpha/beta hydrolase n=1 Tax=Kineococcus siccus TaxID=2696567 RepID=UPI0014121BFC|nr:alpha/beta hydrolase [Kineococcus siccus]NAZ82859.1 alpha/beta hydrolase [Kineococcus siccus]